MRNWKAEVLRRLGRQRLKPAHEVEVAEELAQHLEERVEELISRGESKERAEQLATEELNQIESTRWRIEGSNQNRDARLKRSRTSVFDDLRRSLRYAFRGLWRNRIFAAVVILTLGLCIGGNLAIFAVVDSILLRPLPVPDSSRLVVMFNSYPKAGRDRTESSFPSYYARRGKIKSLTQIAGYKDTTAIVGEAGSTERLDVMRVTPEFFDTLGVHLRLGRVFTDDEMRYENDAVVILTDRYWRERFNGDPSVLGRTVRLDGLATTVVGVLPPEFRFLSSKAQIFHPHSSREEREISQLHSPNLELIGRLAPGATIEQARAEIAAQDEVVLKDFPEANLVRESGYHTVVKSLHEDHVESIRPMILLMQWGVLFLLLIGGVNLVNLMLVRASGRAKELSIRQSLGARRSHIVQETVVENVLLALFGGIAGVAIGAVGIQLLAKLGIQQLPLGAEVKFTYRLAIAGSLAATATGLTMAIPVVWLKFRLCAANSLQTDSRSGTATHGAQMLRHAFIATQIALAFVLLTGAGLLGLSLKRIAQETPGFRPDHVITGRFNLPWKSYHTPETFRDLANRALEKAQQIPGVSAVAIINAIPLQGGNDWGGVVTVPGYEKPVNGSIAIHWTFGVTGKYFQAMGIPLREGRYIDESDSAVKTKACVVDENFAKLYWGSESPIGRKVYQGSLIEGGAEPFTIVGVVGAVKQTGMTDQGRAGAIYYPYRDFFSRNFYLVARTSLAPEITGPSLANAIREVDPELPLSDIRSMEARISDSLVARRSPTLLAAIFSGLALALAAIGTYGALSYAVSQRRKEIGVRIALGAMPRQITKQFLSIGIRLLGVGLGIGIFVAWLSGFAMRKILYGVPALHPGVLAAAALILAVVSFIASLLPSSRASRVEPMDALRSE